MAADLFVGGRYSDSLTPVAGSGAGDNTGAGTFDASYCDSAVIYGAGDEAKAVFLDASLNPVSVTSGQTLWTHFEFYNGGGIVDTNSLMWCWRDSSGFPWVTVKATSASNYAAYYNSGTGASPVWTQVGAGTFSTGFSRYAFDISITLGSPHSVAVYRDGVQQAGVGGTFTQASLTNLRAFHMRSWTTNNSNSYSQLYITEGRSTINAKVKYSRANGAAAANTGWGGAQTNVNEAVNSDATADITTAAGLRQTYPMTDVTVPANFVISSVWQWLRAKNDGAAPANIKSSVRIGATNYDYASNMPGIGVGFVSLPARYDVSPATGVVWTQAEYNGAELGYLSVT